MTTPSSDHVDRACPATRPAEHEQRRENRRKQRPEERNDRHQPGEDSERQPVRNVEQVEPDRGKRREHRHREELADNVRAQRVGKVAQHVANKIAMDRREQRDEPLAVHSRLKREIDAHHHHCEDVDQHVHEREDLRHEQLRPGRQPGRRARRAGLDALPASRYARIAGNRATNWSMACSHARDVVRAALRSETGLLDDRRDEEREQAEQRDDGSGYRQEKCELLGNGRCSTRRSLTAPR